MPCQENDAPLLRLGFPQMTQTDLIILDEFAQTLRRRTRKLAELAEQTTQVVEAPAQHALSLARFHFGEGDLEIYLACATQTARELVSESPGGSSRRNRRRARQEAEPADERACGCVFQSRL
jgi:hypothetical protein